MSRRPSLPQPSRGISRVDQKSTRTHGYVGRLGYRQTESGWRPAHKAFFGDASHGGPAGALKAAEAWLKSTRRKLAAEAKTGAAHVTRPTSRPATRTATRAGAKPAKPARTGARPAAKRQAVTKRSAPKRGAAVRVAPRKKKAAARAR